MILDSGLPIGGWREGHPSTVSDVVTVTHIRHRYGEQPALDGVSFNVSSGECFGLLGPNGSGKTTLFRILSTLLVPSEGRATVCGHDVVSAQARVRQHIGVIFQSPGLDLHLTVEENLRHAGHLYGLGGKDLNRAIDEALTKLNVATRAKDLVKKLSGGLRRRVELAKCLLHRPTLLILDEPSTGLDPRARTELWSHLEDLRKQTGVSILVTTHLMAEADGCDRLGILDQGRLVVCDTPSALKRRIGGDCVIVEAENAHALCGSIAKDIGGNPVEVNGAVRIETDRGPALVSEVVARFGDEIKSITLGKPTLEDVFIHETGHRFQEAPAGQDY